MKRSTHLAIGAAMAAPLIVSLDPVLAVPSAGLCLVGSILPDWLDFQTGLRRPVRIRHRGVSHSLLALAIAALGLWLALEVVTGTPVPIGDLSISLPGRMPEILALALGVGYASHLAADACTPAGIQPFLPIFRNRLWLLPRGVRLRTGGPLETLLQGVVIVLLAFLAFAVAVRGAGW